MVNIGNIKITDIFGADFLYIEFSLADTTEDITEYRYDVLRSTSQYDGFTVVKFDCTDFYYKDYEVNLYNPAVRYFYKIRVTHKVTKESVDSDIYDYIGHDEPDIYGFALLDMYNTYLETAINNETVYLLKKMKDGPGCSCVDDIRGRSSKNDCPICFGTGIVGGYFKPQPLKVSFMNSPSKMITMSYQEIGEEDSPIQFWTSNYPLIQNEDIIVDKNNVRYIIMNWQPTYKNYTLLRQQCQMKRLPRYSCEYTISIGKDEGGDNGGNSSKTFKHRI